MGTIYGADWFRNVVVGESGDGSGFGTEASWRMSVCVDSDMVEDVGTGAAVAYCLNGFKWCLGALKRMPLMSTRAVKLQDMLVLARLFGQGD